MEGLGNAEDHVRAWWTDNRPGEEFPTVFSGDITVCFTPDKDGFEEQYDELAVAKGFWEPQLDTNYDSEKI